MWHEFLRETAKQKTETDLDLCQNALSYLENLKQFSSTLEQGCIFLLLFH